MTVKIDRNFFTGAVKSLFVIEERRLLLVGLGSYVELRDIDTDYLYDKFHLFDSTSDSIHGFKRTNKPNLFLAFGGKTVIVFELNDKCITTNRTHTFPDWLMDVQYSKSGEILGLSAHNLVISDQQKTTPVNCKDESCILYSGKIIFDETFNETIVIGGTVFKQVIIWSASGSNCGQLYARLEGHEGVIFSVECFNDLICSTSDDRTARLWKIERKNSWKDSKVFPLHVLKGEHSCRVFRSHFLSNDMIITGGEDSLGIFWDCETGRCLWKVKANDGSSVWSLSADPKTKCAYFGGRNGAVKKVSHSSLMSKDSETNHPALIKLNNLNTGDVPKLVQINPFTKNWLVLTQGGQLWKVSPCEDIQELLANDDDLKNYALLTISNQGIIFLATICGQIKWSSEKTLIESSFKSCKAFDGKIFAMTLLPESNRILVCGNGGKMKTYTFKHHFLEHDLDLILPPCKEQRFFSCAAEIEGQIIIGDRCGNVHIYSQNDGCSPILSIPKVHRRHGVGSILFLAKDHFLTTGRDGSTCEFRIENGNSVTLLNRQNLKITWIERFLCKDEPNSVLGFHSSKFVIHSIKEGINIVEIECGGM